MHSDTSHPPHNNPTSPPPYTLTHTPLSESVSDVAGFQSVLEAMRKLGFPAKDVTNLFRWWWWRMVVGARVGCTWWQ